MYSHSERDTGKGYVAFPSLAVVLMMSLAACLTPGEGEKEGQKSDIELAKLADNHCEAWIAQNKDNLPTTYDDVVRSPAECRRRLFAELSPEARSTLWRTQIERYRAAHPSLNAQQRVVLDRAFELMSPAMYATTPESPESPASNTELESLFDQSMKAFGKEETRILFGQIGPGDEKSVKAQFGGH